MAILTYLKQRQFDDWLIGYDSREFYQLSHQLFSDWSKQTNREAPLKILLAEKDSVRFLASFVAAVAANCQVFLCNPNWVEQEWQQVFNLIQPDLILGDVPNYIPEIYSKNEENNEAKIMIPTGGTSGKVRFAIHTWETLIASAHGFKQYFEEQSINSFCVLPLYHVSGLMQFIRSFTTGGKIVILPFKSMAAMVKNGERKNFYISLVPTQLAQLLNKEMATWLSDFKAVLLGGAPAWAELLEQARNFHIPIALTYGMTETASQIVTLKPEAFLRGNNSNGQVLPHAQLTIQNSTGKQLGVNQIGLITIKSDSLMLGYYPHFLTDQLYFQTDDLGFFDVQGYLTIVGRNSNKIITGGENVFPGEVEAAIQATKLVVDVCVIGISDLHWGQAVTAIYVPRTETVSQELLKSFIEDKLSKYKQPKYWLRVESLPRNYQGKVNIEQLKKLVNIRLNSLTSV
ncbi:MAG: 2-succinylbenzoate--CoA ligase [Coleofasciculaceae cyanobacterium]